MAISNSMAQKVQGYIRQNFPEQDLSKLSPEVANKAAKALNISKTDLIQACLVKVDKSIDTAEQVRAQTAQQMSQTKGGNFLGAAQSKGLGAAGQLLAQQQIDGDPDVYEDACLSIQPPPVRPCLSIQPPPVRPCLSIRPPTDGPCLSPPPIQPCLSIRPPTDGPCLSPPPVRPCLSIRPPTDGPCLSPPPIQPCLSIRPPTDGPCLSPPPVRPCLSIRPPTDGPCLSPPPIQPCLSIRPPTDGPCLSPPPIQPCLSIRPPTDGPCLSPPPIQPCLSIRPPTDGPCLSPPPIMPCLSIRPPVGPCLSIMPPELVEANMHLRKITDSFGSVLAYGQNQIEDKLDQGFKLTGLSRDWARQMDDGNERFFLALERNTPSGLEKQELTLAIPHNDLRSTGLPADYRLLAFMSLMKEHVGGNLGELSDVHAQGYQLAGFAHPADRQMDDGQERYYVMMEKFTNGQVLQREVEVKRWVGGSEGPCLSIQPPPVRPCLSIQPPPVRPCLSIQPPPVRPCLSVMPPELHNPQPSVTPSGDDED